MAKTYKITAQDRQATAKAVRRQGKVPGVLYGHDTKPQHIETDAKEFAKMYREAGSTSLVTLTTADGKEHPVLLREVQVHPVKGHIIHVDYYRVRMDEVITAQVPLNFIGESPAVKEKGGVLVRNIDELELEALPKDLPHDIEVDISSLDSFDKLIRLGDLKIPAGVKVLLDADAVVALVQPPRTEEEIASLATEVKEDVEAVEGVKKEEPAEAEGEAKPEGEKKGN